MLGARLNLHRIFIGSVGPSRTTQSPTWGDLEECEAFLWLNNPCDPPFLVARRPLRSRRVARCWLPGTGDSMRPG
jgi:hypothetical protein